MQFVAHSLIGKVSHLKCDVAKTIYVFDSHWDNLMVKYLTEIVQILIQMSCTGMLSSLPRSKRVDLSMLVRFRHISCS